MPLPPLPPDLVHLSFGVQIGPTQPTFGFWMLWPGSTGLGAGWAQDVADNWVVNPQGRFLDCMHGEAIIETCRISVGGTPRFDWQTVLAPNHGALTAGQDLGLAVGLYVQSSSGGRGSGSRIHIPGVGNEMTTDFAWLSAYGQQQLTFAADALAEWPSQLALLGLGTPVLGTVQRRRGATYLNPPTFDPAQVIRPSLLLETMARRQKMVRGLSS